MILSKKFRDWLGMRFAAGSPSNEEWEVILAEDGRYYSEENLGSDYGHYFQQHSPHNSGSPDHDWSPSSRD